MRHTVLVSVVASLGVSAVVTAMIMLVLLPPAVDAQIAQLVGPSLTIGRPDGHTGVNAELGAAGGGVVRVFGSDGQTLRLSLNSAASTPGPAPSFNAGLNVYNVEGLEVVRLGSYVDVNGYGLGLRDSQGNRRLRALVDGDGNAMMQILDAEGNVIWSVP